MKKDRLAAMCYSLLLRAVKIMRRFRASERREGVAVVFIGALGDFITFCGAAELMAKNGHRLTLICRKNCGIEEFAEMTGLFYEIIPINNSFCSRITNILRLNRIRSRYVFSVPLCRYILNDIYALSVSADICILPDTDQDCFYPSLKSITDKMADLTVKVTSRNEYGKFTQFLSGCHLVSSDAAPFVFKSDESERENCIAVFPGASVTEKCWPSENFAWVVNRLYDSSKDLKFYILGGNSDRIYCNKLENALRNVNYVNLCGKMTIPEIIALLKKCRLVLTNDSGGAHMGISAGTATVVIAGRWQYGRFFPGEGVFERCRAVFSETAADCSDCSKSIPNCTGGRAAAQCIEAVDKNKVYMTAVEMLKSQK